MQPQTENQYRVFLSYAHADAQTDAGKKLIASFKEQINAALQSAAGEDLVFLDSEALEWGDEWSSKITECLHQCKVLVCLLSPNYQQSAYCKRERLMWERKEIRLGRLHKGTFPVYYIKLEDSKDEELLALQMDDAKPFFESLDEIRQDIVAEKIERVKKVAKKVKNKELVEEQASSVKFGFLHISPNFVGRLGELSELCEICSQRHIPIVTGGAGVGKSELVVAYASGYAERYPQGRFMLHMEGVEDWSHAVVKLVEDNSSAAKSLKDLLDLPEDYDKLPLDEKRKKAVQSLWKRSQDGRLLLILDNLDKLSLVSDNGLNKLLDGVGDLPENVDIIATSRNNNLRRAGHVKALSGSVSGCIGLPVLYEIDNLDTASAFELFCRIKDDQFPFAKCNPECMKEDVRKEYDALMEIISYLKGHAWSLEIIAALMAENTDDKYTFQCKLEEIRQTTTGIAGDDSSSNLSPALTPGQLLQPTFDCIAAMDHGCRIGVKILELATVASFFPPDMVSDEALLGYWKKYYTEFENVGFDAGTFALKQLHALHLINGEGGVSKMHRLTRDVLLESQSEADKLAIVKQMQVYWDEFHAENPNITLQQVQPWTEWAPEWFNKLIEIQKEDDFLWCLISISHDSKLNNLYHDAEKLSSLVLENARKMNNELLVASGLGSLASIHDDLNLLEIADREYQEAISIRYRLMLSGLDNCTPVWADTLNNLAALHSRYNRPKEAEGEYKEALKTYRRLAISNPERYTTDVAMVLNNLASLHSELNQMDDADHEYEESLSIRRRLAQINPVRYRSFLATTLNNLANFHKRLNRPTDAEREYTEALSIRRSLAVSSPEHYNSFVAATLNNLANLHVEINHLQEAEREYSESLEIYRSLVKSGTKHYTSYVAGTLSNFANLHKIIKQLDMAEHEYNESLEIYRGMAKKSPERYDSEVARTLNNLALLHNHLKRTDKAECEFNEALVIYRYLAEANHDPYDTSVANTLNNIAIFHRELGCLEDAEHEHSEALSIYNRLASGSPDCYDSDVADTLNNLAIIHTHLNLIEDAKYDCEKALAIYLRLEKKNPSKFKHYVDKTKLALDIINEHMAHIKTSEDE